MVFMLSAPRLNSLPLATGRMGSRQQRVDRRAEAALHGVARRRQEEEGRRALRRQLQDGQVKVAGPACSSCHTEH